MNGHLEAEERQDQVRVYVKVKIIKPWDSFLLPLVPVPWSLSLSLFDHSIFLFPGALSTHTVSRSLHLTGCLSLSQGHSLAHISWCCCYSQLNARYVVLQGMNFILHLFLCSKLSQSLSPSACVFLSTVLFLGHLILFLPSFFQFPHVFASLCLFVHMFAFCLLVSSNRCKMQTSPGLCIHTHTLRSPQNGKGLLR